MFKIGKNKNGKYNVLLMSDLHLCHNMATMHLVEKAYEYAYLKGIRYVINLGDLIEGVMPHNERHLQIGTVKEQVEYVISNYPKVSGIKTLMLYGNHDYYSMLTDNYDVAKEISNERKDIINLGYGEGCIKILSNYIKLSHEIPGLRHYKSDFETFITLIGHTHAYRIAIYDDNLHIYVPSLSFLKPDKKINTPAILDADFKLNEKGIIDSMYVNYVDMEKGEILANFTYTVPMNNKKYLRIKEKFKEYNNYR